MPRILGLLVAMATICIGVVALVVRQHQPRTSSYVALPRQLHRPHGMFLAMTASGTSPIKVVQNVAGYAEEMQEPLMEDIERLSGYLGEIIKRENPKVYDLYERYREHALRREKSDDQEALLKMVECSKKITPDDAFGVVRAFTQTLNLINSAEVHHRMRLLRNADIVTGHYSPLPMREDSVAGTMSVLIDRGVQDNTATPEQRKKEIFDALLKQKVDIVLTAHPTEVNRRTLLRKYRGISETLAVLDRKDLSPYEKAQAEEELRREICSIWYEALSSLSFLSMLCFLPPLASTPCMHMSSRTLN